MKHMLYNSLIAIAVIISSSYAARLEVTEKAQQYISKIKTKDVSKQVNLSNPGILEKMKSLEGLSFLRLSNPKKITP